MTDQNNGLKDFKESDELPKEMLDYLEGERLVLLATVDPAGAPNVSAISWVKAKDVNTIRFSVASNSRIVENLKNNKQTVFTVQGLHSVYTIQGTSDILEEAMEGVPMKLAKIETKISKVRNSMFWGAELSVEPEYVKTYNPQKAKELDDQVYESLMK